MLWHGLCGRDAIVEREVSAQRGGVAGASEESLLIACTEWVVAQGLSEGEFLHQLLDSVSGESVAVLDFAWPDDLQLGISEPVALLLGEPLETQEVANRAGYRLFTDPDAFAGT